MPSPRPFERTSTLSMPSSPSRNENWSIGLPAVFSALGAEPSSGMRNRLELAPRARVAAPPLRRPYEDRIRRYVEDAPRRADHRRALALELGLGEIADRDRVQRDARVRVERLVGAVDARRRRDALEVRRRRAGAPLAHRRELGVRVGDERVEVERRVEDELRADQPARVVARGVVVVRAQVIGALVREPAGARDVEQADLGAAARVAVADHRDRVAGDQHLVVPRAARVDVGAERVGGRHRLERAAGDADGEEAPAPQHDEVLAVQLDDPALVDAGVLDVGDRVGHRLGRLRGRGGGGRRTLGEHALRRCRVAAQSLFLATALRFLGPALEEVRQLLFAGERGERLLRRGRGSRRGMGDHIEGKCRNGGGEQRFLGIGRSFRVSCPGRETSRLAGGKRRPRREGVNSARVARAGAILPARFIPRRREAGVKSERRSEP